MDVDACKRRCRILTALAVFVLFAAVPRQGGGFAFSNDYPLSYFEFFEEKPSVAGVIRKIGPRAEARIKPFFEKAGLPYPSRRLAFVVLKEEKKLEVWTRYDGNWVHVRTYDILAASGSRGPKRKKGDYQVPEGIYQIVSLNPASRFHLSMKINYPNAYDLQMARNEQRSNLGGDIFIHGKTRSHGCLAMGNKAIEELFVLVAKTRPKNVKVVIAPHDLRKSDPALNLPSQPSWLPDLYGVIGRELAKFRLSEDAPEDSFSENNSKMRMTANPEATVPKEPPVINQPKVQEMLVRQNSEDGKAADLQQETVHLQ